MAHCFCMLNSALIHSAVRYHKVWVVAKLVMAVIVVDIVMAISIVVDSNFMLLS